MRAAIYARVSTKDKGQDVSMQTKELERFAGARSWQVTDSYVDEGISGSKDSRPQLNRLMADARLKKFDAVLVWKLDRFGRSLRHLINAIAELEALGVKFISLRDNLDLTTPAGRLMFQIIGAMAEFERALIQERVKAGMRNALAKGKPIGPAWRIVDVATVVSLRKQGLALGAIAKELRTSKTKVCAAGKFAA
jgi:DNA invertase Pin-like site-specific DNA recombinase